MLLRCIGGRAHLRPGKNNGNQEKTRNNSNLRHKYRIVFSGKGGAQSNKLLTLLQVWIYDLHPEMILRLFQSWC